MHCQDHVHLGSYYIIISNLIYLILSISITGWQIVTQCSRNEFNRVDILNRGVMGFAMQYCKKYSKHALILRSILKLFNWITTNHERMLFVCDLEAIDTVIRCIIRHKTSEAVLAPSILFLTRASKVHPPAMAYMLKKKAIGHIINALKALYTHDVLQLEGLQMIQTMSKTSEGWKQISETRGGWQSICQGTALGDALVHELPGHFNNPGWCIGETPYLPEQDRKKQLAAKIAASRTMQPAKALWTAGSLREYMGLPMKGLTLAINLEYHNTYFEMISTLDLLPAPGELMEHWFQRIKRYETEMHIELEDMCNTMIRYAILFYLYLSFITLISIIYLSIMYNVFIINVSMCV